EKQWLQVIGRLRSEIEAFITLGDYHPEVFQGPSIWIKCMIDKALPEADWDRDTIPVIYLPGVGKADFKNIEEAPEFIQPLMEYQFTGNIWTQENGRDWTILSFLQNADIGMGLNVSQDKNTKEALVKSLPKYLEDPNINYQNSIDAEFLNKLMFPHVIPTLLRWMEEGDKALASISLNQQEAFKDVVENKYQVPLDYSQILEFVERMGTMRNSWHVVWQYFANAPGKYPKILRYLQEAKPDDMGDGFFTVPESSWPQVN